MRMRSFLERNPISFSKLTPANLLTYTPVCNITDEVLQADCLIQLSRMIQEMTNWFKVSAKVDQSEVGELAAIMLTKYSDLSMPDFVLFVKYAKAGSMVVDGVTRKFELPYNRLDGPVLIEWLNIYREAKNEAREKAHRMAKQAAAQPFQWTPEQDQAFCEYMKELRSSMNEPKERDHEAEERERMARREQMISITMNDFAGTTTEELERCRPMVEGDMILMAAIDRILAARKGVAE